MTATIEARGLTKRYGKTVALDGLDLVADAGQVVAVLGPNGAGKTTFVRAVATLLRADAGTLLRRRPRRRRDPAAVRRVIGLAGPVRGDRAGDDRAREPRDGRPPVRAEPPGREGERRRRARAARAGRRRRPARPHLLGRHAPAARPRREPRRGAAAAAARRADHRARPAQPDRVVGRDPRARARRDRRAADHPVPRRGRPSRQPGRDHRPRPVGGDRQSRPSSSAGSAATSSSSTSATQRDLARVAEMLGRLDDGETADRRADPPRQRARRVRRRGADGRAAVARRTRASSSTTSRCASRTSTRCSSP